jgi:hypothetical protein
MTVTKAQKKKTTTPFSQNMRNKATKGEVEQLRKEMVALRKKNVQPAAKRKATSKTQASSGPIRLKGEGSQVKLHNASIPRCPMTWKFACADSATRSSTSYTRLTFSFNELVTSALQDNKFNENTIFVFMPAVSDIHLAALDAPAWHVNHGLKQVARGEHQTHHIVSKPCAPMFAGGLPGQRDGMSNYNRVAVNSGGLSISCKFPGTSAILNIRRLTISDVNERKIGHASGAALPPYQSLLESLRDDTVLTYHIPISGNERVNMYPGIHNTDAIGKFTNTTAKAFKFYDGSSGLMLSSPDPDGTPSTIDSDDLHEEPMGGIVFSFSNIQYGTALAKPAITISTAVQYTRELSMLTGDLKDHVTERAVNHVKDAYAHQAKMGPFKAGEKTSDRIMPKIMSGMPHGFEALTRALRRGANYLMDNPQQVADAAQIALRYIRPAQLALE